MTESPASHLKALAERAEPKGSKSASLLLLPQIPFTRTDQFNSLLRSPSSMDRRREQRGTQSESLPLFRLLPFLTCDSSAAFPLRSVVTFLALGLKLAASLRSQPNKNRGGRGRLYTIVPVRKLTSKRRTFTPNALFSFSRFPSAVPGHEQKGGKKSQHDVAGISPPGATGVIYVTDRATANGFNPGGDGVSLPRLFARPETTLADTTLLPRRSGPTSWVNLIFKM